MDFLVNCSACGHSFGSKDIFLVFEGERQTVFHTSCSNCLAYSLVFISENSRGVAGMSLATDLDRDEVREKFSQGRITVDDVVDAYQMAENPEIFLDNFREIS